MIYNKSQIKKCYPMEKILLENKTTERTEIQPSVDSNGKIQTHVLSQNISEWNMLNSYSNSLSFDRRCNDLERWLLERGYKEKKVQKQVLTGRAFCKNDLLKRERTHQEKPQITFNFTYLVFKNVWEILEEFCLLLAPDEAHKKVFSEVPNIGFKISKSFKDHLIEAVLPQLHGKGKSKPCEGEIHSLNYASQLKIQLNLRKQSQEKLLTFLTFDILNLSGL